MFMVLCNIGCQRVFGALNLKSRRNISMLECSFDVDVNGALFEGYFSIKPHRYVF